ncbi:hypothetical protein [uncultured Clostridium sp.]|uniref:hypothetical protein n=1 Tax=uncultured Clostridium sp. TaxID=59620 RepID=UPI0028EB6525|nr:hypothetical protein [uncultured Clostridium sp.]
MPKNKVIFRFNEDTIDLVLMEYKFNKTILKNHKTLAVKVENNSMYSNEKTIMDSKLFIEENNVVSKMAIVILALDGVITRLVETPYMKKKELQSFIKNNINDYFTVNMQDYYYDYRIVEVSSDKVKKFSLLLAVIPKTKLNDIHGYLEKLEVKIEKITIYPECIANLLKKREDNSIAIVDFVKDGNNITILNGNKLFLHSSSHVYGNIEENYEEVLDNIGYFLNFYSTRHFGSKVDKIYILGKVPKENGFLEELKKQIDIPLEIGIDKVFRRYVTKEIEDIDFFSDVFGCDFKGIDFKKSLKFNSLDGASRDNKQYIVLVSSLVILTFLWSGLSSYLINRKINSFDITRLEEKIKMFGGAKEEYNLLMKQRKLYEKDQKSLERIKVEGVEHIYYLEEFRHGLPSNILVESIHIEKDKIELKVNIDSSTMDRANLYIAINNMNLFKKKEIESIKLDDTENEDTIILEIKNP